MSTPENIHPTFGQLLDREAKEALLNQCGLVVWLYGLSGSGKSTLATALERRLHEEGVLLPELSGFALYPSMLVKLVAPFSRRCDCLTTTLRSGSTVLRDVT